MAETMVTDTAGPAAQGNGLDGFVSDWSSDQRTFKNVPWGKAMMWIFLLSDTFIFSCFLLSYMTVRMTTTVPWPNPSEVFALSFGGDPIPLIWAAFAPIFDSILVVLFIRLAMRSRYRSRGAQPHQNRQDP